MTIKNDEETKKGQKINFKLFKQYKMPSVFSSSFELIYSFQLITAYDTFAM